MNIDFLSFDSVHQLGESATGAIAHFSGPLASLLLLVEYSPRRRRPCKARMRLQAQTVPLADNMVSETPATP